MAKARVAGRIWSMGVFAALVLLIAGCGTPMVKAHSVPDIKQKEGLVAVALFLKTTQTAEVHIAGPEDFSLGKLGPGMHFWVFKLPVGSYCSILVNWTGAQKTSDGSASVRDLVPCIDVRPGVLTYSGHYAVGVQDTFIQAMNHRADALSRLKTHYPELLDRYPLQEQ